MSKVYLYTARATTAEKVQFDKKDGSVVPSIVQEQFNGNLQCVSNMMGHSHKVREKNHAAL